MAARTAQETTRTVTPAQALAFIERHGIVCEAARRGDIASLADAVAEEPIRGNWWSHPRSKLIFAVTRAVRAAPQILVCRLVDDKITFVHERLWPALLCAASRLPQQRLARIREVHLPNGRHKIEEQAFPNWIDDKTRSMAKRLTASNALQQLAPLRSHIPLLQEASNP